MAGTTSPAASSSSSPWAKAHSPITPTKLYPALRYRNEFGRVVRTPLSKILSFSEERQNER